jgi:hypothetical protein
MKEQEDVEIDLATLFSNQSGLLEESKKQSMYIRDIRTAVCLSALVTILLLFFAIGSVLA